VVVIAVYTGGVNTKGKSGTIIVNDSGIYGGKKDYSVEFTGVWQGYYMEDQLELSKTGEVL
jgi:hypothetical protein